MIAIFLNMVFNVYLLCGVLVELMLVRIAVVKLILSLGSVTNHELPGGE